MKTTVGCAWNAVLLTEENEMLNFNAVPVYPSYESFDGCVYTVYPCADAAAYRAYLQSVAAQGFVPYAENEIEDNHFASFTSDTCFVQTAFIAADRTFRVAEDAKTALYPKAPQVCERIVQPCLWQFETDHTLIDCGMCYVMQCADGSFFVIDSAHSYSVRDNDRLHDFLIEHTPEGQKCVIAGWYFSHGHADHICKFTDFLKYNMADVTVERLYFNFISQQHPDAQLWDAADRRFTDAFLTEVAKHPEIPVVYLHIGERFYVRDFAFTVLCTHEEVYPGSFETYNNSSTVLLCEAEGNRIFFPGDASDLSDRVLLKFYKDIFACDILQVSHHGHMGLSPEFYKKANAPVVLFPTTQIKYDEEFEHYEANRIAVNQAKECYISANGTVKFPLPYQHGTAVRYPDETFESFTGVQNLWNYTYTAERKQALYDAYLARGGKPIAEYEKGFE